MVWQVTFEKEDGEQVVVSFDDLSPDVFAEIAKDSDAGLTYWGIYSFPKETPETLYRVLCACAEHAGIEPPSRAETMRQITEQSAQFSTGPDISKQPAMNGFPPVPSETEAG